MDEPQTRHARGKKPGSGCLVYHSVHKDYPEQQASWTDTEGGRQGLQVGQPEVGAGARDDALHGADGCTKWHGILYFETTGFMWREFHLNEICKNSFKKEKACT